MLVMVVRRGVRMWRRRRPTHQRLLGRRGRYPCAHRRRWWGVAEAVRRQIRGGGGDTGD